jgi:hypothetical protein
VHMGQQAEARLALNGNPPIFSISQKWS